MAQNRKSYSALDSAVLTILRSLKESANMTGRALSRESGISHNRLAKIIRGETPPPTVNEVSAIAVALGAPGWLVLAGAEWITTQTPPANLSDQEMMTIASWFDYAAKHQPDWAAEAEAMAETP